MADYWKSQPRKFCDFCKCWIADNKPLFHCQCVAHETKRRVPIVECIGSRDFHERGKRHQENVAKKITEVRKKGLEQARNEKECDGWMERMEREAMKKLREDLKADPSLASQYGVIIKSRSAETKTTKEESTEKVMKDTIDGSSSSSSLNGSDKVVEKSDSGRQQGTGGATGWQELQSADGYPYYWNTQTGEVSWELPSSIATVAIQSKEEEEEEEELTSAPSVADNDEKSSSPKEAATKTGNTSPPPKSPATEEVEEEEEAEKVESVHRKPRASVYGEWQELKDESEPLLDLELPVDEIGAAGEVRTIVIAAEPKMKFKEKTMETLRMRSKEQQQQPVEFKRRKLNSAAAKGNIRRAVDEDT